MPEGKNPYDRPRPDQEKPPPVKKNGDSDADTERGKLYEIERLLERSGENTDAKYLVLQWKG